MTIFLDKKTPVIIPIKITDPARKNINPAMVGFFLLLIPVILIRLKFFCILIA